MTLDRGDTPAGSLERLSAWSLTARPWIQPGYEFRCISIHDHRVGEVCIKHPFVGWADVQVGDTAVAMLTANDDGVALIYHFFGPDAYESASVAAWTAVAAACRQIADIGAFTGLFSLLAQKVAPEAVVLAVEPNSASRARLHTNLVWNGMHNQVKVAPYAIGAHLSTLPLFVPMGADVLDTGSSLQAGTLATRVELVTAGTIDTLFQQYGLDRPDLLKVDVEGLEEAALLGAGGSLANKATIFLEIQSLDLFLRCRSILVGCGYRMLAIDDDDLTLKPCDASTSVEAWYAEHVRGRTMNYLCIARDEHLSLAERGVARVHARLAV